MRKTILRALAVVVLGALLAVLVLAQGNWVKRADAPVSGGYGEAIVGSCQYIYLLKELYASSAPEFWQYGCQSDAWQAISTDGLPLVEGKMPFRTGTALAWDGGNFIYALGGGRGKDTDQRLFFRYVISKDHWETLKETPHPQGAGDALVWSGFDYKLYAFLGSYKLGVDFAVYDPRSDTWDDSPPERWPAADDGASLAWTGGEYIYALHGEAGEGNHTQNFAQYHIPSGSWEDLQPIPQGADDGGSLIWVGNHVPEQADYIYALSGAEDEKPGNSFYRYIISKNEWEPLTDIPCPVGYYTGNRLASACGHIYYWQGAPSTERWECESGNGSETGRGFYMFEFPTSSESP